MDSSLYLGVSGGVDSVVLAALIARLRDRAELPNIKTISIVHVNHSLRGKESEGDMLFVQKLASTLNFEFLLHTIRWKKQEKKNQAACREKRIAIFKQCLSEANPSFLVLAHHEDDQAETVLLRLLRGTGLSGLAGMRAINGPILRPLLTTSRRDIESLASCLGLPWREDRTNKKTKYERNWLRLKVMPLLASRRPGVSKRLAALAKEAQDAFPNSKLHEVKSEIMKLSQAQKRSKRELCTRYKLNRTHTERLHQFIQQGKSSRLSLPKGEAWISSDWFFFAAGSGKLSGKRVSNRDFSSVLGVWRLAESGALQLRSKGSSAAVKKALVRAKVPAFLREAIPLAVAGDKLVALVPKEWSKAGYFRSEGISWEYSPSKLATKIFHGSSGRTEP